MGSSQVDCFPTDTEILEDCSPVRTDAEILEDCFPDYLAMGMPSYEYWNCDSDMTKSYRKAHQMKLEQMRYEAWLHGSFVYVALACVAPLFRDFGKARKAEEYPAFSKGKTEKQTAEEHDLAVQDTVLAWIASVNKKQEEPHNGRR